VYEEVQITKRKKWASKGEVEKRDGSWKGVEKWKVKTIPGGGFPRGERFSDQDSREQEPQGLEGKLEESRNNCRNAD